MYNKLIWFLNIAVYFCWIARNMYLGNLFEKKKQCDFYLLFPTGIRYPTSSSAQAPAGKTLIFGSVYYHF